MSGRRVTTPGLNRYDVDVHVLKYTAIDKSSVAAVQVGKHSKVRTWDIQVGRDAPLTIEIVVDKVPAMAASVRVEVIDGEHRRGIWPQADDQTTAKMTHPVAETWQFMGTPKGMNQPDLYEVRPPTAAGDNEVWFPAILTAQNHGGVPGVDGTFGRRRSVKKVSEGDETFDVECFLNTTFDALVKFVDVKGFPTDAHIKDVKMKDIREVDTLLPLTVPSKTVTIEVPDSDPDAAVISVLTGAGGAPDGAPEIITHFFARPSPPANRGTTALKFAVTQDRKKVTSNLKHTQLQQLLTGEVMLVGTKMPSRDEIIWTFRIGPFNEHEVKLAKTRSKIKSSTVTLTVDGTEMVDALAKDIDWNTTPGCWECRFQFFGETVFQYNVFETNIDGQALDTKGTVDVPRRWEKTVTLLARDGKDLSDATCQIDAVDLRSLRQWHDEPSEVCLDLDSAALESNYQLQVPYKVNMEAKCHGLGGFAHMATGMQLELIKKNAGFELGGIFACCSGSKVGVLRDQEVIVT